MPIIHLEDLDDPRLAAYSGMTDAQLRDCPDSTHGLFIGESRKVIERALAAGVRMRSLFMEEKWLDQTMPLVDSLLADDPDFPVLVATREQFRVRAPALAPRGGSAGERAPSGCVGGRDELHEHRRRVPLGGGAGHRRGAGHAVVPRPAVPSRRARVDGDGVPGAVDAHRKRARLGGRGRAASALAGLLDGRARAVGRGDLPARRAPARLRQAGAGIGHRGRRPRAFDDRELRLHGEDPHGSRGGLLERGRR